MRTQPLKRFIDPNRPLTYGIVQAGPDEPDGVPYIRPADMDGHRGVPDPAGLRTTSPEIAQQYRRSEIAAEDIVVTIGPSYGKTMIVPPALAGANLTQGTARVAPGVDVAPRYLVWALQTTLATGYWNASVSGATFSALNLEPLSGTPIPLWASDEQRRIADFLDAETARIDALIAAKQQMLQVGTARMKSFVVSTLDNAVRHPLKRQAALIDCKHRTPTYTSDGYPVVSPGDVTAGDLDLSRCHRFVNMADWEDLADGPRRPRAGDIVYSRNASVGLAALVRSRQQFCMGQDVCLVRASRPDGDGRFLTHVLNTIGLDQIDAMKVGSTFFRVNVAQIAELQVPALSAPEQDDLVRRWDAERARLDDLASTLTTQIALLRERRQALITAAVTGEIEV